ncbi:MAG: hypothetical protein KBG34_03185 [Pseudoxanthomonas sp.]|nr:hypothetical protein [Thermomonas sp.]MBP8908405.1 hypothetical protein [Pseudoxanthomonas sp.]
MRLLDRRSDARRLARRCRGNRRGPAGGDWRRRRDRRPRGSTLDGQLRRTLLRLPAQIQLGLDRLGPGFGIQRKRLVAKKGPESISV